MQRDIVAIDDSVTTGTASPDDSNLQHDISGNENTNIPILNNNNSIEDELTEFIKGGIALTAAQRQSYKARGGLQNMMIKQFFDGVKREMNTLHRPIANFIG